MSSGIFIAYAEKDTQKARLLSQRLNTAGFRTWMKEERILPGQEPELETRKALDRAELAIICLSSETQKEGAHQRELAWAWKKQERLPEGGVFAIPALLAPCEPPFKYGHLKPVSLYEPNGFRILQDTLVKFKDKNIRLEDSQSPEPEPVAQRVPEPAPDGDGVDVVVLTALVDEYKAVLAVEEGALGSWTDRLDSSGFTFRVRPYASGDNRVMRLALAQAPEMGGLAAAQAAGRLVRELRPKFLAMCGICAGRRGKVALGDVIVADRVFQYDDGKMKAFVDKDGVRVEEIRHDIRTYHLDPRWKLEVEQLSPSFCADLARDRPPSLARRQIWVMEQLVAGYPAPQEHRDRKQKCPQWAVVIRSLRSKKWVTAKGLALTKAGMAHMREQELLYPDGPPEDPPFRVRVGPIATGNRVVEDGRVFDRLSKLVRKTIGLEMEAAAIGMVAGVEGVPMIVAKGVADHGDLEKDDTFRSFAARVSARFLLKFLRNRNRPGSPEGKAGAPPVDKAPGPRAGEPAPKSKETVTERAPAAGLFVGRERELEKLVAGLKEMGATGVISGRLFQLEGAGGIGKTTLAREAARRLQDS
ncbi:MAG: TIR domain-containing protein, partial [Hyphomicrobiales bacterium]|nr:TIR domain-containing protein [Hyphomicrobiales bacterium]